METNSSDIKVDEVAKLAGVTPAALRMWQCRYGWPTPGRAENGYRLYSPALVAQIVEVSKWLKRGWKITQIIKDGFVCMPKEAESRPRILERLELATAYVERHRGRAGHELLANQALKLVDAIRLGNESYFMATLHSYGRMPTEARIHFLWMPTIIALNEMSLHERQSPYYFKIQAFLRGAMTPAMWMHLRDQALELIPE